MVVGKKICKIGHDSLAIQTSCSIELHYVPSVTFWAWADFNISFGVWVPVLFCGLDELDRRIKKEADGLFYVLIRFPLAILIGISGRSASSVKFRRNSF